MKKFITLLISLVLVLSMVVPCFATEKPKLSFTAVSDMHLDDLFLQSLNPNIHQFCQILADAKCKGHDDLFISGGDISSYGNSLLWYQTRDLVRMAGFKQSLWILGNHEYGTFGMVPFTQCNFKRFAKTNSIYYTRNIKGYTFICLGVEWGIPFTEPFETYSEEQLDWLETTLGTAIKNQNGKPIFVVGHYKPTSAKLAGRLDSIMEEASKEAKVPIIYLWGHEHGLEYWKFGSDDLMSADEKYASTRMGSDHYYLNPNADALYVDVYNNKVVLTLDRVTGFELKDNVITLEW